MLVRSYARKSESRRVESHLTCLVCLAFPVSQCVRHRRPLYDVRLLLACCVRDIGSGRKKKKMYNPISGGKQSFFSLSFFSRAFLSRSIRGRSLSSEFIARYHNISANLRRRVQHMSNLINKFNTLCQLVKFIYKKKIPRLYFHFVFSTFNL